jgi:hypothetical protein
MTGNPMGRWSAAKVTPLLVWGAIVAGGIAGYAGWAWWIGPAIGATAGVLNFAKWLLLMERRRRVPALSAVRLISLLIGAIVNIGLVGTLPYGMYALVRWLVG